MKKVLIVDDYTEVQELLRVTLEPKDFSLLFAKDGAEALYKRALETNPSHAHALGDYASFLADDRADMDGAEALYKRALEANPNDANNLANYASFLADDRAD